MTTFISNQDNLELIFESLKTYAHDSEPNALEHWTFYCRLGDTVADFQYCLVVLSNHPFLFNDPWTSLSGWIRLGPAGSNSTSQIDSVGLRFPEFFPSTRYRFAHRFSSKYNYAMSVPWGQTESANANFEDIAHRTYEDILLLFRHSSKTANVSCSHVFQDETVFEKATREWEALSQDGSLIFPYIQLLPRRCEHESTNVAA